MRMRFFVGAALLLLAAGCATLESVPIGNAMPTITQSFASPKISPGDTWRIYLNASSPDGKMKKIFVTVLQAGVDYPTTIIKVKEEDQKKLSGYIFLNTLGPGSQFNFVDITVVISIQDESGQFSQKAAFPVSFQGRFVQEKPAGGIFAEKNLGAIVVALHPIGTQH